MMPCYICYDLERPEAPQHRGPDRMPERVVALAIYGRYLETYLDLAAPALCHVSVSILAARAAECRKI